MLVSRPRHSLTTTLTGSCPDTHRVGRSLGRNPAEESLLELEHSRGVHLQGGFAAVEHGLVPRLVEMFEFPTQCVVRELFRCNAVVRLRHRPGIPGHNLANRLPRFPRPECGREGV